MVHKDIFKAFSNKFQDKASKAIKWVPNGRDRIRVCFPVQRSLIFTYRGEDDWSLEPANRRRTK